MAEGLQTPDGQAVEVDAESVEREFARAMSAPSADALSPPKKPAAPATDAAKPKRGRPPKSEQARVTAKATATAPAPEIDKQRAEGVKGFGQIGAGICLMMDARTPETNISWRADAVTIANAAEPLAIACVGVAKTNPGFARALDKVTQVGPYGALISVGLGIAGQLARNHGIAAGEMLGAVAPEKLLESLEEPSDGSPVAA
jgi:hypothetical protein